MELIPFSIIFWTGAILSHSGYTVISAFLLILCGISMYFFYMRKYRSLIVPVGILSLSWISCIGLSCFKLSNLQNVWEFKTWLVFYIIYLSFAICFKFTNRISSKSLLPVQFSSVPIRGRNLFSVIVAFTLISVLSFSAEALILGFIPLFTVDTPHAYSSFHISGLHYFTVLCVLVPSLSVLYLNDAGKDRNFVAVILCSALCMFLPILLVSRFQLVFSVLLAFITLMILHESDWKQFLRIKFILTALFCFISLIGLYVFITVERAHSIEYLNGIFEMKDPETPIFITQPYIYIVNNFENFNCLIRDLGTYSYGLRMAFPLFALSGLKFLFPEILSFPLFITKEELTTLTMFYDAYYDFGIIGSTVFSGLLGFVYGRLYFRMKETKRPFFIILLVQLLAYLTLAFFTTWFSNPTTWFYIGICLVADIMLWYTLKRKLR